MADSEKEIEKVRDEFNGRMNDMFDRIEKMVSRQGDKVDELITKLETLTRIEVNQLEHAKGLERAFNEIAQLKQAALQRDRDDEQVHGTLFTKLDADRKETGNKISKVEEELKKKLEEAIKETDAKHTASKTKQDQLDGAMGMGKVVWSVVTLLIMSFVAMVFTFQRETTKEVHQLQTEMQVHHAEHSRGETNKR